MADPALRRDSMQFEASRQAELGNVAKAQEIQAQVDFRNQFPLEIGWGTSTTSPPPIDLERGELYPTLAIAQAMQKWIACEQGRIVACIKGAPPPAGVLRPGELAAGAGGTVAAGAPPAPRTGVVLPATSTASPGPILAAGGVPWWLWPAAIGVGVLVILATGRRKAA